MRLYIHAAALFFLIAAVSPGSAQQPTAIAVGTVAAELKADHPGDRIRGSGGGHWAGGGPRWHYRVPRSGLFRVG